MALKLLEKGLRKTEMWENDKRKLVNKTRERNNRIKCASQPNRKQLLQEREGRQQDHYFWKITPGWHFVFHFTSRRDNVVINPELCWALRGMKERWNFKGTAKIYKNNVSAVMSLNHLFIPNHYHLQVPANQRTSESACVWSLRRASGVCLTCKSYCQIRGCVPAQSQTRVGSVSECFWGWRGALRAPGTQLWRCHSQCVASAAAGKDQEQQCGRELDIRTKYYFSI